MKSLICLFFWVFCGFSYAQSVKMELDRREIKIGEQIRLTLTVEADTLSPISFPTQHSFVPLEMVEALPADTLRQGKMWQIEQKYRLTQFDSGSYTLPPLHVFINKQPFATEPAVIKVLSVQVDTLKQGLYPIKPMQNIEKPADTLTSKLWWALGALFLCVLLGVVYFRCSKGYKRKKEVQKKLPPLDKALQGLRSLQQSRYLIENNHKGYYSELTDIVRRYLEEEIDLPATESTTEELIDRFQALLDAGRLQLSESTINELKTVLFKADLVKFAKNKPHDTEAESDRSVVESIVIKTNKALLTPNFLDEQEQNRQAEVAQKLALQKRRKRMAFWGCVVLCGLLALGTGLYLGVRWFAEKENKSWVTSSYGYPPVSLTLHEPLLREKPQRSELLSSFVFSQTPTKQNKVGVKLFITNLHQNFEQKIGQVGVNNQGAAQDVLQEAALTHLNTELSINLKGENILTKEEAFTNAKGVQGLRIFGSFMGQTLQGRNKMQYEAYYFTSSRTSILLLFTFEAGNAQNQQWIEKVRSSIDFPTQ